MNKNTEPISIGTISENLKKKEAPTRDPIALEREMHKDYEKNISLCLKRGKKEIDTDFYLVVNTKKERLMDNVIRNYFFYRKSCPTPEWDQIVYKYLRSSGELSFLWVVPSKYTCEIFKENVLSIDRKERELLRFVLDYEDGTLFRLAKKENGEKDDTPELNV